MSRNAIITAAVAALAALLPHAAAQAQCPNPSHDCCTPGPGGCSSVTCCQAVCAMDPFCCVTAWDALCVEHALNQCARPCEASSNCCSEHPTAGCDDVKCMTIVCELDPTCCSGAWDNLCAIAALDYCPACGGEPPTSTCPGPGDCCVPHASAGCADASCCGSVCALDPFCCETAWDASCAATAAIICGCVDCPPSDHGCFETGSPGCSDDTCCSVVCAVDPACCQSAWDVSCVARAAALCDLPDCPITCNGTDEGEPCGMELNNGCNTPPSGSSSCCFAWGGAGCDDATCQSAVCAADPTCCDQQWDVICANLATTLCDTVCPVVPLFGSIACGETICGTVWAEDGARDTDWFILDLERETRITVSAETRIPMVIGLVDPPSCSQSATLSPVVSGSICDSLSFSVTLPAGSHWVFAAPLAFDGFPCGGDNRYALTVTCGSICDVGPDRNGDGCVNGTDLSIVVGQWDPTGLLGHGYGPGDANCDGVVNGADLSMIIGGWQPICP